MFSRIALRIATIEALKGETSVADNVLDSQIGALDVAADGSLRTDQEKPFISVYVEAGKSEGGTGLRALHRGGATDLVLEFGITAAMTEIDPDTGSGEIIGMGIPATDAAFEFYLDVLGRQILDALTDPQNEWAEIWRGLSRTVLKSERRRMSDQRTGTRIAAHQLIVTLDLLPDPLFGEALAPGSIWKRFLDKAEDHPWKATLAGLIGTVQGSLDTIRRRNGLTLEEARALALAAAAGTGAAPAIDPVSLEIVRP